MESDAVVCCDRGPPPSPNFFFCCYFVSGFTKAFVFDSLALPQANDPQFATLLSACQAKLDHKLPLKDYLLIPVQRIMRYHLLLAEQVCAQRGECIFLTHSLLHSLTHSFTHSLTPSLTPSLTRSLICFASNSNWCCCFSLPPSFIFLLYFVRLSVALLPCSRCCALVCTRGCRAVW